MDEVGSLFLSARAVVDLESNEHPEEKYPTTMADYIDEDIFIDGVAGEWALETCLSPEGHFWIVRTDIDPWNVEGYRVDTCEPCLSCEQLRRDIDVAASLRHEEIIDGVEWTLRASDRDGSPEYLSRLGWIGRPHACNRTSLAADKPWVCGARGEEPYKGSFKTMRAAARGLKRVLVKKGGCARCGESCWHCRNELQGRK